jgi:hypothetical protein
MALVCIMFGFGVPRAEALGLMFLTSVAQLHVR